MLIHHFLKKSNILCLVKFIAHYHLVVGVTLTSNQIITQLNLKKKKNLLIPQLVNTTCLMRLCLGTRLWLCFQKFKIFFLLKLNIVCMFWIVLMC